ncbi:hypothetical protein PISMIDRAFT_678275 [Pisolithus microcarpus 441]|uniref:Unplaced genomic scaffold scaffold_32, whole genome shotgun sequence n=1 Tax=Pisolithus microcarpus 441 TaxID=765257 RepID=A0A0C9ZES0_9AGAM|nr:hypothetical protein PISMIDRAFT_678275 [Pisolithus microcarpus 441]
MQDNRSLRLRNLRNGKLVNALDNFRALPGGLYCVTASLGADIGQGVSRYRVILAEKQLWKEDASPIQCNTEISSDCEMISAKGRPSAFSTKHWQIELENECAISSGLVVLRIDAHWNLDLASSTSG